MSNKHAEREITLYSLADIQLRFLCPADLDEVRTRCQDWFPIEYPLYWYEEITSSNRLEAKTGISEWTNGNSGVSVTSTRWPQCISNKSSDS